MENGTFWSEIRVWIWKTQVAQPHQKFRRAEPPGQKEETELHYMNLNLADFFKSGKPKIHVCHSWFHLIVLSTQQLLCNS